MTDADLRRYSVIISPAAEADLDAISDYLISQRAEAAADRLLLRILDRIAALDTLPLRGPVPRELEGAGGRGFRQIISGPSRVIYQVGAEIVTVVLVADGRRDMKALLTERLLGL